MDVAGLHVDLGAERIQCLEMQIDRPRADRAAARQRHARRTETGQQRRQDENAGAHAADHVVGRLRVAGSAGIQHQRPPGPRVATTPNSRIRASMVSTSVTSGTFAQFQRLGAEQRGGDLRQRRVLRAADLDRAFNASAAANDQPVHAVLSRPCRSNWSQPARDAWVFGVL